MKVFAVQLVQHSEVFRSKQPWHIVAAQSRAAAHRAFLEQGCNLSLHFLSTYGAQTKNEAEVAAAMSDPGTVFVNIGRDYDYVYKPLKEVL